VVSIRRPVLSGAAPFSLSIRAGHPLTSLAEHAAAGDPAVSTKEDQLSHQENDPAFSVVSAVGDGRENGARPAKKDQVHLFVLSWNEAKMLPYFFRHYSGLVDKFFIFDNGSTDGSLELLAGDERVSVVHWDVEGESFVEGSRQLYNNFWKRSRGQTDWAIIVEVDEHLYHPDLRSHLQRCAERGITVVKPIGYEMIADEFPTGEKPLWQLVTRGVRSFPLDKCAIFNPSVIEEMNYSHGRHEASPTGRVIWEKQPQVRLLHYKRLGADYVSERNRILSRGIRSGDIAEDWGLHYFSSHDEVVAEHQWLSGLAAPVPDLPGTGTEFAPEATEMAPPDDRAVLRDSGLFQPGWYLAAYPDVADSGVDPLEHFCRNGWREGRKPNPHFETAWYLKTYGTAVGHDVNPLVDYVTVGEVAGRRPFPKFDPIKYRARYGLGRDQSPLRHHLARKSKPALSSAVSRLINWIKPTLPPELPAEFDPQLYLDTNPDVAAAGMDPADHYLKHGKSEGRRLRPPSRTLSKRAASQLGSARG
jgi:hypothetical protein